MPDGYEKLLDAAIRHLEEMKSKGARFVTVSAEAIDALSAPTPRPAVSAPPPDARVQTEVEVAPASAPAPQKTAATARVKTQEAFDPESSTAAPAPSPPGPEAKETAMAELRERAMACQKCPHLASSRKNVVFGVGDIHSPLMFVGEAPGADEDAQGEPFVGRAGQLLTRIIQTMGFTRQTVYIANILKCRPDTPGQPTGNRKPTADEMKTCLPYLLAQIDLIQPQVIVALGATAVEGLLGKASGISKLRGNWQTFRNVPVMPTFHPAYLLRDERSADKRKVWEDMLQVLEKLGRPITAKQRNFFLKAQAGAS
jgi:uracil-DNA glycosylase